MIDLQASQQVHSLYLSPLYREKSMRLLTFCIFLCCQIPRMVNAEGDDVVVRSLSMWRMCEDLENNSNFRKKLQLTGLQVKKVIALMSSKRFHDRLKEQDRLALLRSEGSRADGNHEIYWTIEEEVVQEVKSFLSEKQIRDLKSYSLETRCSGGLMAFYDREICDACGIAIGDEFRKFLQQKSDWFLKQQQELTTKAITSYLREFPASNRVLMAQFLGNKYLPGILAPSNPNAEVGKVPFIDASWAFQEPTLRELVVPKSSLASLIGITSEQEMQLADLKQSVTNRTGTMSQLKTYFDKLKSILSASQIVELARIKNAERLSSDFSWPFRSPDIKAYLGLDDQEARDWLSFSEDEDKNFREQLAALERRIFLEVCEKVPQPGRQRIQKLYAEVWLTN